MSQHHRLTGRPLQRRTARVIERDAGICWLCGHPGARSADHITPVSEVGDTRDEFDLTNLRAAHGQRSRCPTCGKACNEARGNRAAHPVAPQLNTSRDWF